MKILVIGESCRDVFHYGKCDRLAPEAPAPVFNPIKTVENGCMAKNVHKNLLALGVDANLFTNENWNSITKTRYIDLNINHMFLRVDENDQRYGKAKIKKISFEKQRTPFTDKKVKTRLEEPAEEPTEEPAKTNLEIDLENKEKEKETNDK